MSGMKIGGMPVTAIRVGTQSVQAVRAGTDLLWSRTTLRDTFDRADTLDLSAGGGLWADQGPSSDFFAGIVNGTCRLNVPDNIASWGLNLRTSRKCFTGGTLVGDFQGYVEARIASMGNSGSSMAPAYITQVFAKVSDGAFANGIGFQLDSSTLRLVRRVSSADTVIASYGAFALGDVIRLSWLGDVYTLWRNGSLLDPWTDSGSTVVTGAGSRSMGIRVDAAKEVFGARKFSPALDYVEMG